MGVLPGQGNQGQRQRSVTYVVVECGQAFHLPLYDVESGHLRMWDVLRSQYVQRLDAVFETFE